MKACLIPPRGLEGYALHSRYHLALALPELVRNNSYVETYQRAGRGQDHVTIDNGEAEGAQVSTEDLFAAAKFFMANEIVLPDVIGSYVETYTRASAFMTRYDALLADYKLMAVAQGQNDADLKNCISKFATWGQVTTIGIPRHVIKRINPTARIDLANWIKYEYKNRFQIHLLGVDPYHLGEIEWAAKYASHVRSIDSSLPFNYALMGSLLSKKSPAITRPQHYFTKNWATVARRDVVLANIATFKEWAHDLGNPSGGAYRTPASGSGVREVSTEQLGDEVRTESGKAES